MFWNSWAGLADSEILDSVETSLGPIEAKGAAAKRVARERLEDWGDYAVPGLVRNLAVPAPSPSSKTTCSTGFA